MVSTLTGELERLLADGQAAARGGDFATARTLLTQLVDQDPHNEQAWMWLSGVVSDPEEQQICLENVLVINPANSKARRGLDAVSARTGIPPRLPEPEAPEEHTSPLSASQLASESAGGHWLSGGVGATFSPAGEAAGAASPRPRAAGGPDQLIDWMQPGYEPEPAMSLDEVEPAAASAAVLQQAFGAPPAGAGENWAPYSAEQVAPAPSPDGAGEADAADGEPPAGDGSDWDAATLANYGITIRAEDQRPAAVPTAPPASPPAFSEAAFDVEPFAPEAFGGARAVAPAGGAAGRDVAPSRQAAASPFGSPGELQGQGESTPAASTGMGPMGPYADTQLPAPSELPAYKETEPDAQPWYLQPAAGVSSGGSSQGGPGVESQPRSSSPRLAERPDDGTARDRQVTTIECPACREKVPETSLVCSRCHYEFFVNCPHCHELVDTGDAQKGAEQPCPYCGKPIDKLEMGMKGGIQIDPLPGSVGVSTSTAGGTSMAAAGKAERRARAARQISFAWLVDLLWLVLIVATVWALSQLPVWLHLTGQY